MKRNWRTFWWGWKRNEKAVLILNIQKISILASGRITSRQIDGEKVETVTDFIFLASKITADSYCSHEIKKHFLLGRKAMTSLESMLKSWDITLPTKVCFSSSHVQVWELDHKEDWPLKNWCFWIVVLEKTLESPWTVRRSNQSTLKQINSEYLWEGLRLKLKLQYFSHLMQRADSLEKTLMLGKTESRRRRGQ